MEIPKNFELNPADPFQGLGGPAVPPVPTMPPVGAPAGGLDWSAQTAAKPESTSVIGVRQNIQKKVHVVGYIAPKFNYLSPKEDPKEAKALFTKKIADLVAKAGGDKLGSVVEKKYENGALIEVGRQLPITDQFSMKLFRSLMPDEYIMLKNRGDYEVRMAEKTAEFYVLKNTEEDSDIALRMSEDLRTKAAVVKNDICVIRPQKLGQLMLVSDIPMLYVFDPAGKERKGFLSVLVKESKKEGGQPKASIKIQLINAESSRVSTPGDLGIPYAVNKSYKGDPVAKINSILNEAKYKEFDATTDPTKLARLKQLPKKAEGETVSPSKKEEIAYQLQQAKWEALGITPEMLAELRSAKTTSKSIVSIAQIEEMFRDSVNTYKRITSLS